MRLARWLPALVVAGCVSAREADLRADLWRLQHEARDVFVEAKPASSVLRKAVDDRRRIERQLFGFDRIVHTDESPLIPSISLAKRAARYDVSPAELVADPLVHVEPAQALPEVRPGPADRLRREQEVGAEAEEERPEHALQRDGAGIERA